MLKRAAHEVSGFARHRAAYFVRGSFALFVILDNRRQSPVFFDQHTRKCQHEQRGRDSPVQNRTGRGPVATFDEEILGVVEDAYDLRPVKEIALIPNPGATEFDRAEIHAVSVDNSLQHWQELSARHAQVHKFHQRNHGRALAMCEGNPGFIAWSQPENGIIVFHVYAKTFDGRPHANGNTGSLFEKEPVFENPNSGIRSRYFGECAPYHWYAQHEAENACENNSKLARVFRLLLTNKSQPTQDQK